MATIAERWLAQGEARGKAEGKAEGKKDVARQMKQDGLPIEQIIKYTGLTAEEIGSLSASQ